jgi:hypothetical protein
MLEMVPVSAGSLRVRGGYKADGSGIPVAVITKESCEGEVRMRSLRQHKESSHAWQVESRWRTESPRGFGGLEREEASSSYFLDGRWRNAAL